VVRFREKHLFVDKAPSIRRALTPRYWTLVPWEGPDVGGFNRCGHPRSEARFTSLGVEPTGTTPEELAAIMPVDAAH